VVFLPGSGDVGLDLWRAYDRIAPLRAGVIYDRGGTGWSEDMIVRVSEAHVRDGLEEEFLARLRDLVSSFPDRYEGLVRHAVLVDLADPRRVQYVSEWADEAALVAFAGEGWRTDAVTFPDEDAYLTGPLVLRHHESIEIDTSGG
jgi:heme-degrading monooxygenase HmoA